MSTWSSSGASGGHVFSKLFGDVQTQVGLDVAAGSGASVPIVGRFYGAINFGQGVPRAQARATRSSRSSLYKYRSRCKCRARRRCALFAHLFCRGRLRRVAICLAGAAWLFAHRSYGRAAPIPCAVSSFLGVGHVLCSTPPRPRGGCSPDRRISVEPSGPVRRSRGMRVLLITKIFPNATNPVQAPFNRRRSPRSRDIGDIDVFATIPWFPWGFQVFSVVHVERRASRGRDRGLPVRHPRFLYAAQGGALSQWPSALCGVHALRAARHRPAPDVIVGSFAYPDGFAAVCLAELLGVPAVVKVHGSDVDVLCGNRRSGPRSSGVSSARPASSP